MEARGPGYPKGGRFPGPVGERRDPCTGGCRTRCMRSRGRGSFPNGPVQMCSPEYRGPYEVPARAVLRVDPALATGPPIPGPNALGPAGGPAAALPSPGGPAKTECAPPGRLPPIAGEASGLRRRKEERRRYPRSEHADPALSLRPLRSAGTAAVTPPNLPLKDVADTAVAPRMCPPAPHGHDVPAF
jgi:hypothetical protein